MIPSSLLSFFAGLLGTIAVLTFWCFHLKRRNLKLERFRRDFVAQISHEFRTPLTIIKGYTETLKDHSSLDQKTRYSFFTMMEDCIHLLIQMVDDVLELSRMETINPRPSLSLIRLPNFLENLFKRFRHQLESKKIRWKTELESPLENIETDARLLELILSNLVDNAIKYSGEGGEIRIEGKRKNSHVEFSVHDNGIGIAPEHQERIFERFYRAHREKKERGTGLGLAIVRHAVQSLGGVVGVESHIGNGSRFYFTIK